MFHTYKIKLTCQVVKFKNVELIVNMFVRFALDAPDARHVVNLAVLEVEMMEIIQTAHQNGLREVIPKTNGIALIMTLKKILLKSMVMMN